MCCTVTLKRLFPLFLFVAICLVGAGIAFIVYGAMNYESTTLQTREGESTRFGAVIDAGGSGTRLVLYSYRKTQGHLVQRFHKECESKGIAKYVPDQLDNVTQILSSCLNDALKSQALPRNKKIPLYFGATGGMRILKQKNIQQYEKLWKVIRQALDNSDFNVLMNETISGKDEAVWGWLGSNSHLKTATTTGILDMGSTSLQISFEPRRDPSLQTDKLEKVMLNNVEKLIYGYSYLCYGRDQMEARFIAKLIKESGYKNVTDNPCMFNGYEKVYNSSDLFTEPCVYGTYAQTMLGESIDPPTNSTNFTVRGTGNQSKCSEALSRVIKIQCTGEKTTCGLNDIYQPIPYGKFHAISTFYYTADYMNLSAGSDIATFKQKTVELCRKPWPEIRDKSGSLLKFAPRRCFDASYSHFVLTRGFNFTENSKDIQFVQKVEGKNVQWSLGLIYNKKDDLPSIPGAFSKLTVISQSPNMLILAGIGGAFLLIGIILLVFAIRAKRRKDGKRMDY